MSLRSRWTYAADGPVLARPTVANETVYVGYNPGLVALATESGSERRAFDVTGDVRVRPRMAGDRLIAGSNRGIDEGYLSAFDPERGTESWSRSYDAEPTALDATRDTIVLACDERLFGYTPDDGSRLWTYDNRQRGDRFGYFSDVRVLDETAYASSEDDTVYAIDVVTGEQSWAVETTGNPGALAIDDGTLFVGPKGVQRRMNEGTVYALDAETGTITWETTVEYGVERPAIDEEAVYVAEASRVQALDRETGARLWNSDNESSVSNPVVVGDHVYVGTEDGTLVGIERGHGDSRAHGSIVEGAITALVAANTTLYAVTESGTIAAVETGQESVSEAAPDQTTQESVSEESDKGRTCPECGSALTCEECGAVLQAEYCPACGVGLATLCPSCGADLAGDENFCPECGYDL